MTIGVAYEAQGSIGELLVSVISHVSVVHLAKNLATVLLCFVVLHKWSSLRWFSLLSLSLPVNYVYGETVAPVMGLSGGTFAVLGASALIAFNKLPKITVLFLVVLAMHQATITKPEIAIAHSIAFLLGILAVQFSQLEVNTNYNDRINKA